MREIFSKYYIWARRFFFRMVVESIHCDDDKRNEYAGIRLYFKMMCEILERDFAGFLDQ